jgi:hypothetical protein
MLWLDRLTFFFLCVLIFVLPASIAGVSIFSILAILLFLAKKISYGILRQRELARLWPVRTRAVMLPFGLYILIAAISIFFSSDPQQSISAIFGKVLHGVVLSLVVMDTLITQKRFRIFLGVWLTSAFVLCLDGLWQLSSSGDLFKNNPIIEGRMSASMRHPNDLGAYLIVVVPVAFMLIHLVFKRLGKALKDRELWSRFVLAVVCFATLFSGLVLTYSRGAWVGLLVGMLLWAVLRRSWKAFLAFLLFFIFVLMPLAADKRFLSPGLMAPLPTAETGLVSRNQGQETGDVDQRTRSAGSSGSDRERVLAPGTSAPSTSGATGLAFSGPSQAIGNIYRKILSAWSNGSDRQIYWKSAISIIQDHPWTGTGLNTYSKVIRSYSEYYRFYAHNCYLQTAAEIGILGMLVLIWMFLSPLAFAWRRLRSVQDPAWQGILCAVMAGYLAIVFECGLDTTFYSVQLSKLMWIAMGLLVAIPLAREEKSSN